MVACTRPISDSLGGVSGGFERLIGWEWAWLSPRISILAVLHHIESHPIPLLRKHVDITGQQDPTDLAAQIYLFGHVGHDSTNRRIILSMRPLKFDHHLMSTKAQKAAGAVLSAYPACGISHALLKLGIPAGELSDTSSTHLP